MQLPDTIIQYLDQKLPGNWNQGTDVSDAVYMETLEDRAFRNGVESMALAFLAGGISEVVVMSCVQIAVEAYGNNA